MISSKTVFVVVQGVAVLVDVGEHDALAQLDGAGVGLLLADDHAEERGLAGAVGADHADDAAARHVEAAVLHEIQVIAVGVVALVDVRTVSTFSPSRGPGAIWMIVSLLASSSC